MGISINGPSGIDTGYIIESLVQLEQDKITKVEDQKDVYQKKADAYTSISTLIKNIATAAGKLKKESDFNLFKISSTNDDLVTVTTDTSGSPGTFEVGVFQTAQREKLISNKGLITSQTASLTSLGIAAGSFKINGVDITIDDNDTINDLRYKINSTTDSSGKKSGVTATVMKTADNEFRLVVSSNTSGSSGATYQDVSGSVLQTLGIITDAAGTKPMTQQKLKSADNIQTAFAALTSGTVISYNGVDHEGNAVSNTYTITGQSTEADFLSQIEKTFHGMVSAQIDSGTGELTLTDRNYGSSKLALSSMTFGTDAHAMTTDTVGAASQNVLTEGTDAFFSVDSLMMSSTTNSASGFITGVTFELHKASFTEKSEVILDRDYDGLAAKVESLTKSYNELLKYIKDSSVYGDESKKEKKGVLAGDMTARSILDQVKSVFTKRYDTTGTSTITSIGSLGIKTNTATGELELDKTKLTDMMKANFDDVLNVFITSGTSNNPKITMGRYTDKTEDGIYTLTESTDQLSYQIQRTVPSGGAVDQSDERQGEILNFSAGPATGLSLTAAAGSGNGTFTFFRGFAGHLELIAKKLTDGENGAVKLRQTSLLEARDGLDDRISRMNASVETYRLRLVKEFTAMEQNLNNIKSQSNNMLSQLGYSTN
ncbi:MAG: flagellar filament capping protein FliD [Chitinivibrionales bacterium]|nr:flagellar filament capping protein FliD [Chitinivibrionales bacterium]